MAKSKVALAKTAQGWTRKNPKCGCCLHFTATLVWHNTSFGEYREEKNKRCTLGGFATGKSCWCTEFEWDPEKEAGK